MHSTNDQREATRLTVGPGGGTHMPFVGGRGQDGGPQFIPDFPCVKQRNITSKGHRVIGRSGPEGSEISPFQFPAHCIQLMSSIRYAVSFDILLYTLYYYYYALCHHYGKSPIIYTLVIFPLKRLSDARS